MNKKLIEKIANEIIIDDVLSGKQKERIEEIARENNESSYQELAHFIAPKINANPQHVYYYLQTYDK